MLDVEGRAENGDSVQRRSDFFFFSSRHSNEETKREVIRLLGPGVCDA